MSNAFQTVKIKEPRCLTVLIPVYNEDATLNKVLDEVFEQKMIKEVIAVNDGSTDNSGSLLDQYAKRQPRLKVLHHVKNLGKGAAINRAMANATGEIVIIQDADLEYSPEEYRIVIKPIVEGRADVVYGSRFQGSGEHRVFYFWHAVGNKLLTFLSNMTTNLTLTDMETCYKAIRLSLVKRITIKETRFGIEPEITAKLAKLKPRIYEVPISYYGRTYEEGKKIGWRDGFSALRCIVKYRIFD